MQRASDAPIRTSTEDLACAQAAAHLGNWRWEMQGDRVTWSAVLFRIFGVDKGTFVPTNDAANARIHPDDRARHRDVVGVALPGQTVPPFEMRIVRLDGEERIVLASGFEAELDAQGRPRSLFGTILDVTERRRAEERAERARSQEETLRCGAHHPWQGHAEEGAGEALAKARSFGPDVALVDLGMPGLDGYAFAERARKDAALSKVALVALTGYGRTEDVERVRTAGFRSHLTKPAALEELRSVLEDLG